MVKLSLEEFKELSLSVDRFVSDLIPQIDSALKGEYVLAPTQCTATPNGKFYIISINIFIYEENYNYQICHIQESDADTYLDSLI